MILRKKFSFFEKLNSLLKGPSHIYYDKKFKKKLFK